MHNTKLSVATTVASLASDATNVLYRYSRIVPIVNLGYKPTTEQYTVCRKWLYE